MSERMGDGVNDISALFAYGRDVGTDVTEGVCTILGAKSAGYLLFEFDHADIPFGLVVVEGDTEVIHEGKDFRFVCL